jgi:hypothetical protein
MAWQSSAGRCAQCRSLSPVCNACGYVSDTRTPRRPEPRAGGDEGRRPQSRPEGGSADDWGRVLHSAVRPRKDKAVVPPSPHLGLSTIR